MARRKCFSASLVIPTCCSRRPTIQWKNGFSGVDWSARRLVDDRRFGPGPATGRRRRAGCSPGRGRHSLPTASVQAADGLLPAAELPQRFAPLLARENEVGPFGQGLVEAGERLLVAPQAVQDGAAVVEAQGPALPSLVLRGGGEQMRRHPPCCRRGTRATRASAGPSLFTNSPASLAARRCLLPDVDVPAVDRAEPGIGIRPRQRQLVGHPDALEGARARGLVMAHPAAVRVQADPQQREARRRPTRLLACGRPPSGRTDGRTGPGPEAASPS